MKIEKLKNKIIDDLTNSDFYSKKIIIKMKKEIQPIDNHWGLVSFLEAYGYSIQGSLDFLFGILIKNK